MSMNKEKAKTTKVLFRRFTQKYWKTIVFAPFDQQLKIENWSTKTVNLKKLIK